jgi:hypothetical protein
MNNKQTHKGTNKQKTHKKKKDFKNIYKIKKKKHTATFGAKTSALAKKPGGPKDTLGVF